MATWALTSCDPGPQDASDCLPTLGDHCTCEPQCLTERQIEQLDNFCELGCPEEASALAWECTIVDGECAVASGG